MGDRLLRFIFMDEAGTSPSQPVTVVVGVIIDADQALARAEMLMREALLSIPKELGANYKYSAKDIWGNPAYPKFWPMADRIDLIKSILRIPRILKQAISFSVFWKNDDSYISFEAIRKLRIDRNIYSHMMAFSHCVVMSDKFIRDKCGVEIGMIIAEDHELRSVLAASLNVYRTNPILLRPHGLIKSVEEEKLGYWKQVGSLKISRIRESIHFVGKGDDNLVWIADTCAWAIRKYFEEGQDKFGFCLEMLGSLPEPRDYTGMATKVTNWV